MSPDIRAMLDLVPEIGLVALGLTILMKSGEIDLSVGSVFALTPIVAATLMERGAAFAASVLAGLLAAALVGVVNAVATTVFRVSGVIVTLVTLIAVRLLDWRIAGGFPALLPANTPSWIVAGFLDPGDLVRVSLVWLGAAVALGWVLLAIPGVGERIRASGRSRRKRVPGVPVRRVRAACFVVCAVLAGWAGLIQMLRVGSPLPSLGYAPGWQAWAAALVGGALPVGGLGSVPGALIGTVVVVAIDRLAGGQAPLWSAVAIMLLAALCAGAGLFRARGGV